MPLHPRGSHGTWMHLLDKYFDLQRKRREIAAFVGFTNVLMGRSKGRQYECMFLITPIDASSLSRRRHKMSLEYCC